MASDVFLISERDGYSPKIGILVSQLLNSRHYLLHALHELDSDSLYATPAPAINSIATLLAHLAGAQVMFQAMTFEDRGFNEAEQQRWEAAFRHSPEAIADKRPLQAYLDDLEAIQQQGLGMFKRQDDSWLEKPKSFFGHPANNHYYWHHFLMDEARHTGQIILSRKHLLPQADSSFNPYAF